MPIFHANILPAQFINDVGTFTWTKPSNVTNANAKRDFTFTYYAYASSGSGSYTPNSSTDILLGTLYVHIGYAEIVTQFAGQGGFVDRLTVGGPTVDNTVVVGQKVYTMIETSSKVWVDSGSIKWTHPTGGDVVYHYVTNESMGYVTELSEAYMMSNGYYSNPALQYYYVNISGSSPYTIGGLSATMNVTLANGKQINGHGASESYYVGAPTGVDISATQGAACITKGTTMNEYYHDVPDEFDWLKLLNGTDPGMEFEASITAPTINGAGKVDFLQTVVEQGERSGPGSPDQEVSSHGATVLDTTFPYSIGHPKKSATQHLK